MKKIKLSLVAVALIVSTGISLATNAERPMETMCSGQPNGGGGAGTVSQFGCGIPGSYVCCYRIPDNLIIYRAY